MTEAETENQSLWESIKQFVHKVFKTPGGTPSIILFCLIILVSWMYSEQYKTTVVNTPIVGVNL